MDSETIILGPSFAAIRIANERLMSTIKPIKSQQFHLQLESLTNEVGNFALRYRYQIAEDEEILRKTSSDRNNANDAAFEGLDVLVDQLTRIGDGDEPVGKDALPHLPVVVDLFHKLAKTCEGSVDRMGKEFVDTTQYGGENRQLQNKIQDLITQIDGEISGEMEALRRATEWQVTCKGQLDTAEDQLRAAKDKKDAMYDFVSFFGGGGNIDDQVSTNEQNVQNCRNSYNDAEVKKLSKDSMIANLRGLKEASESQKQRLEELFWLMNTEHDKIVQGRKIDERTWVATRALDYHISTNDVDTSRDDILRHIIQLVHTKVEQVDEDVDVQRFKQSIENRVILALGSAKMDELSREKKYLPVEDVNF